MPLPSPRQGEKHGDFISRCMGDETTNRDFPDQGQRYAVCQAQWSKVHKHDAMADADAELDAALAEVERLDAELAPLLEASKTSRFKGTEFGSLQSRFRRKLVLALRAFQRGEIDVETLTDRWNAAIATAYEPAFRMGASEWPRAGFSRADAEFVRKGVASEQQFISRFARELASSEMTEKQIAARLEQYPLGLESMKTSGWTRKAPPSTMFAWKLGEAVHCGDCPILAAASPFARDELPTVPRAGATCVVTPYSRVATGKGMVAISEIKIGDLVRTHLGNWKPVVGVYRTAAKARHQVSFVSSENVYVTVTDDHEFWIGTRWVPARELFSARLTPIYDCMGDEGAVPPMFYESKPLADGTVLYDIEVEDDHSFILEGVAASNSCRSRCRCSLEIVPQEYKPREVRVVTDDPDIASGVKAVGGRVPSPEERATIDDLRSRINYHRRRIEEAPTEAARRAAIQARKEANAELIAFTSARQIRSVPLLDVGDVISRRHIEPEVIDGLAFRGLDGTTISLADEERWRSSVASLLAQIDQIGRGGG